MELTLSVRVGILFFEQQKPNSAYSDSFKLIKPETFTFFF